MKAIYPLILIIFIISSCKRNKTIFLDIKGVKGELLIENPYNNEIILKDNISDEGKYTFSVNSNILPLVGIIKLSNYSSPIYLLEDENYTINITDSIMYINSTINENIRKTIKECPELFSMDSLNHFLIYSKKTEKEFEEALNLSKSIFENYAYKTMEFLQDGISLEKLFILQENFVFLAYSGLKNAEIINNVAKKYNIEYNNKMTKNILNESTIILEKMKKDFEQRNK